MLNNSSEPEPLCSRTLRQNEPSLLVSSSTPPPPVHPTAVFTPTRIRGTYANHPFPQRYELLASAPDSVAIRYEDPSAPPKWRIQHIHFEGNGHSC
jgi:hypothetical protein